MVKTTSLCLVLEKVLYNMRIVY